MSALEKSPPAKTDAGAATGFRHLVNADPAAPVFDLDPSGALFIKAGAEIVVDDNLTVSFSAPSNIILPSALDAGTDYGIFVEDWTEMHVLTARPVASAADAARALGGFHFAPGGNAAARSGGDETPAINPCSIWDASFRPACPDPRGMALVAGSPGAPWLPPFWCDIYLLAADHLAGTSRFGATIADGRNLPEKLDGKGRFRKLDYETAGAVLGHHGKQLLSIHEFFAAAYGVAEREAAASRAETTALDARRTSRFGLMQAVGQRSTWGHDGDPDAPRASRFGGYWNGGEFRRLPVRERRLLARQLARVDRGARPL